MFVWGPLVAIPLLAAIYISRRGRGHAQIDAEEFRPFRLVEKIPVTHNTHIYRFALPDKSQPLGLPTGQHVQIKCKDLSTGEEVVRPYTPVSLSDVKGHFDLMIKTYQKGTVSRIIDTVKVGESVLMRGPKGSFLFKPNLAKRIGLIAGGTGITPILSYIRKALTDNSDSTELSLIFANVSPDDILLRRELDQLARESKRFTVYYTVNEADGKWSQGKGFVTKEMIAERLPGPAEDSKIFLCGPPPMMTMMLGYLEELGFPKTTVPKSVASDRVFRF